MFYYCLTFQNLESNCENITVVSSKSEENSTGLTRQYTTNMGVCGLWVQNKINTTISTEGINTKKNNDFWYCA
jgi:hypothetical protein